MNVRLLSGVLNVVEGDASIMNSVGDVLRNRRTEQNRLLLNETDHRSEPGEIQRRDVMIVHEDSAAGRIIETEQQRDRRALPIR